MAKTSNTGPITIFGGSGFVGRHLVWRLAATGAEIRIAVRDTEKALFLKPAGDVGQIAPWQVDISDPAQVATAVDGADTVVNLVGILFESGSRTFQSMHAAGAGNIARAAKEKGVRRLIHMSALGADKASPAQYARTKWAGEEAVREAFPEATIFRPSVIFGPEDNFFNMFAGMMRFLPVMPVIGAPALPKVTLGGEGGPSIDFFGDGGCKFQPVFVGDVAQAMADAMTMAETEGETYELGGPRVYSFKKLMELILKITERKKMLVPLPLGVAEVEAMFLQLMPKPLLTTDQVRLMERDNVLSGAIPGFEAFGIEPATAESVLPTYLHRFRTPSHRDTQLA